MFDQERAIKFPIRETGRAAKQGLSPLFPTAKPESRFGFPELARMFRRPVDKLGNNAAYLARFNFNKSIYLRIPPIVISPSTPS